MQRATWKFPFNSEDVLKAAQERLAYHRERLGFWQAAKAEAEKELRATGIQFREPVGTSTSYAGGGFVVDQELERRRSDCAHKCRVHDSSVKEFEAYIAGLERYSKLEFVELTADDIRFFGIAGLDEQNDETDD